MQQIFKYFFVLIILQTQLFASVAGSAASSSAASDVSTQATAMQCSAPTTPILAPQKISIHYEKMVDCLHDLGVTDTTNQALVQFDNDSVFLAPSIVRRIFRRFEADVALAIDDASDAKSEFKMFKGNFTVTGQRETDRMLIVPLNYLDSARWNYLTIQSMAEKTKV